MIPAKITIAVGGSRKAKQWKNKELSWPDILDKLRVTTRTVRVRPNMPSCQSLGKTK